MESPTMQVPAHIAERMEARKTGQASSDIMVRSSPVMAPQSPAYQLRRLSTV